MSVLTKSKGIYSYDYDNDILFFKVKWRMYRKSLDFGNLVVDMDNDGYIMGIRIMDAVQVLGMPQVALKSVKDFKLNAFIEDGIVTVELRFSCVRRNNTIMYTQDFVRDVMDNKVKDSE